MDTLTLMRIGVTLASFAAFLGVLGYVAYPGNARRFEQAARQPLEDGDE